MRLAITLIALCSVAILHAGCASKSSKSMQEEPTGSVTMLKMERGPLVIKPGVYGTRWEIPEPEQDDWEGVTSLNVGYLSQADPHAYSITGLPFLVTESPATARIFFYTPELGDTREMLVLYDESLGTGNGYDTVYVDANRTRDFRDDFRCNASSTERIGIFTTYNFRTAAVVPYNAIFSRSENTNLAALDITDLYGRAEARLRGCWTGHAESNWGPIPFRLLDRSKNGTYSDSSRGEEDPGDAVAFKLGDSPKWVRENTKVCYYTAATNIQGHLCVLKASPKGDSLIVGDYKQPVGHLELGKVRIGGITPVVESVEIVGEASSFDVPVTGSVRVPAGTYSVENMEVTARDGNNRKWRMTYGGPGKIVVEEGRTATISVDSRIWLQIAPDSKQIVLQRGRNYEIWVTRRTSDGGGISLYRPEENWPEGTWQGVWCVLRDPSGKAVDRSQGAFSDGVSIQVRPSESWKPGTYTVSAEFDAGPFGGKLRAKRQVVVK